MDLLFIRGQLSCVTLARRLESSIHLPITLPILCLSPKKNQLLIRYIINHLKVSKIYHYLHSIDKKSENGRFNLGDFIPEYPGEVLEMKGPSNS